MQKYERSNEKVYRKWKKKLARENFLQELKTKILLLLFLLFFRAMNVKMLTNVNSILNSVTL